MNAKGEIYVYNVDRYGEGEGIHRERGTHRKCEREEGERYI